MKKLKRKKLHSLYIYIVLLFVTSFFSFSCKNLFQSQNTGNLTIFLPNTTNSARTAINKESITNYELTLTSQDGQTIIENKINSTTQAKFEQIPIGKYTLSGKAFDSDGILLASNEMEVNITEGDNKITFSLEANIFYALYKHTPKDADNFTDTLTIYSTNNTKNKISTITENNNTITNYAFDVNQNLYYILKDSSTPAPSYSVKVCYAKDNYSNSSNFNTNSFSIDDNTKITVAEDNILYLVTVTQSGGTYSGNLGIFDLDNNTKNTIAISGMLNEKNMYSPFAFTAFNGDTAIMAFVELTEEDSNDVVKLYTITIERTISDETTTYTLDNSFSNISFDYNTNLGISATTERNGKFSEKPIQLEPTDMAFYKNTLFLTLSSLGLNGSMQYGITGKSIDVEDFNGQLHQMTGALIQVTLGNDNNFINNSIKSFGFSKKLQEIKYEYNKNETDFTKYIYSQTPLSNTENNEFYKPVKILAVKKERAWIADDGMQLINELDNEQKNSKTNLKKRVIEVNLKDKTFNKIQNVNDNLAYNFTFSYSGF